MKSLRRRRRFYLPKKHFDDLCASLDRLGLKSYAAYLQSDWWKSFKEAYYQRHKHEYFCVDCGARHGLEIDHDRYDHLGFEYDSDVHYRCDKCHKAKHRRWTNEWKREQKKLLGLRSFLSMIVRG